MEPLARLRAISFGLAALMSAGASQPASPGAEQWDAHVQRFLDDYFRANPTFAVYQGRHEYDGQFPDWSTDGIRGEIARLHAAKDAATRFDTARLDARRRFQRQYLLGVIDRDLFWLEEARFPFRNPSFYGDAIDPNVYVARPYAPLPDRIRSFTTWARNVPAALAQIRATLETPMPRPYVEIGKLRFGGLVPYLQHDVVEAFAGVHDPALKAAFDSARADAAAAFQSMAAWFASLAASATDSFAMGPSLCQKMLWMTERVDLPLDSVEAMGKADLARNRQALQEACAKYAPGKSIEAGMARMSADKPEGDIVDAARAQLAGLRRFVADRDLVSIPGTEQARVDESPPYQRWNFAYIDIPGPYEHGLPSVYYIAPPDPSWTATERAEYLPGKADLLFTSVHEVWPGHFLQFLHSNRSPDLFGRVFVGYAFAEGWAHYAEEMLWEAGYGNGDPATHIGQLSNALLRDARFLASIGMHARGWTQAQAQAFFEHEGLQSAPTAREQAARGTFDPAYLNYTLGKLVIRKLRDEWTASRGGLAAWKRFHDELLSFGGPPIGLVRQAMLGEGAAAG